MQTLRYKNPRKSIKRARYLRRDGTLPERLLWNELLNLKHMNVKFRRQHPLHPYIVDFACVSYRLIVELDGPSHDLRVEYDAKRDAVLSKRGWSVLRFSNEDVLENLESVTDTILEEIKKSGCRSGPTSEN